MGPSGRQMDSKWTPSERQVGQPQWLQISINYSERGGVKEMGYDSFSERERERERMNENENENDKLF